VRDFHPTSPRYKNISTYLIPFQEKQKNGELNSIFSIFLSEKLKFIILTKTNNGYIITVYFL